LKNDRTWAEFNFFISGISGGFDRNGEKGDGYLRLEKGWGVGRWG
jgi:hypothetical protein